MNRWRDRVGGFLLGAVIVFMVMAVAWTASVRHDPIPTRYVCRNNTIDGHFYKRLSDAACVRLIEGLTP